MMMVFFYYSLADSFSSIFKACIRPLFSVRFIFLLIFWFFPLSLSHSALSAETYISLYKFVLLCILCKQAFCIDKCKSHTYESKEVLYREVRKKVARILFKNPAILQQPHQFPTILQRDNISAKENTQTFTVQKLSSFFSVLWLAALVFQWLNCFWTKNICEFSNFLCCAKSKKKFIQNEVHGNLFWIILIRIKLIKQGSNSSHSFNGKNVFLWNEWEETEAVLSTWIVPKRREKQIECSKTKRLIQSYSSLKRMI